MATWAKFSDGTEVSDSVFSTLAKFAPHGTLDVFASDQHNSYLRLTASYLKHVGESRESNDDDVREVCGRFARALGGESSAALFNSLAFLAPGFREKLGTQVMLIGRLEDTNTIVVDGGRGNLAQLSIQPEECADKVDGFKTLVKLDPDHKESWKRNKEWLADVFARARKLGKPLFNETLIFQRPGETKAQMGQRLPEAVVQMAEDFGPHGHFYKTQVPMLWAEEDGKVTRVSTQKTVRQAAEQMAAIVDRPMLLLSAAVDFEQYAAQYAIVADLVAGPMCGRAYFKECFTAPSVKDWDSLEASFARIAPPRIRQIKGLAGVMSPPWWHKFQSMTDEAKGQLDFAAKEKASGVKADFGY